MPSAFAEAIQARGAPQMKLGRRCFLHLAAGAAVLPAIAHIAEAQSYPSRPVHIIVGYAAGGPTDILARLIGQWLSERLGQPFVIEDRPGTATNVATEAVAHAPPDGYTLLAAVSTNTINPALYPNLNFNFMRDIAMIAGLTRSAEVLEVNPALPIKSVSELIAYVKTNPGKLSLASFGTGTISHVAGVLFKREAGIEMVHVPYRGSAPLVVDLLAGHSGRLRQHPVIHRVHQGGQTACARGHMCNALAMASGRSSARRLPARI